MLDNVFTYGTLRPGQPNADLLTGALGHLIGRTRHLQLLAPRHNYFPYATEVSPSPDGPETVGTLYRLPDPATEILRRLDLLEGYSPTHPETSHYRRIRAPVQTQLGVLSAWAYVAGPRVDVTAMTPIPSGDWLTRSVAA